MFHYRKTIINTFILCIVISILGYVVYKVSPQIKGPDIVINEPSDGEVIETTSLNTTGYIKNANSLVINGAYADIRENGYFEVKLPVYKGGNIIIYEVSDRYGRKNQKIVNVGAK